MLIRPASPLGSAQRLATGDLTLGEAFAFLSGLYFRGKLTYAARFGRTDSLVPPVLVITPTRGLQRPDLPVTAALLQEFASVDVAIDDLRYRQPLEADARALAASLAPDTRVVLLGSIATQKYVEPLADVFRGRLHFPAAFVGRGDMSRGALLLRSAAAGRELEYVPLMASLSRRGTRPPRLGPA